jgi:hypothetical protein
MTGVRIGGDRQLCIAVDLDTGEIIAIGSGRGILPDAVEESFADALEQSMVRKTRKGYARPMIRVGVHAAGTPKFRKYARVPLASLDFDSLLIINA